MFITPFLETFVLQNWTWRVLNNLQKILNLHAPYILYKSFNLVSSSDNSKSMMSANSKYC
jgi:hypothetical protein